MSKHKQRKLATKLRKKGYTYNEILNEVRVAKSTLSLWLRSVQLAKKQQQRITTKRHQAQLKAIETIKSRRKKVTKELIEKGIQEVGELSKRDLFILGIALYWAEGSKQSEKLISQGVTFSNMDAAMIKVYLEWLERICKVRKECLTFELYIHSGINRGKIKLIKKWWKTSLGFSENTILKTRFKRHKPKKGLKIEGYYGLLRVKVRRSTNLNRKIAGWTQGIIRNYWGVV